MAPPCFSSCLLLLPSADWLSRFVSEGLAPILNTLLIVVPATVGFAWVFYVFCEKPYMRSAVRKVMRAEEDLDEPVNAFAQNLPTVAEEA